MKKIYYFLPFVILAIVGFSYLSDYKEKTQVVPPEENLQEKQLVSATQTIKADPSEPPVEIASKISVGESALNALLAEKSLVVETKEYPFGVLVESINGKKNGEAEKYWTFSVNGQEATVGAGEYILKDGDAIVWEFKAYE